MLRARGGQRRGMYPLLVEQYCSEACLYVFCMTIDHGLNNYYGGGGGGWSPLLLPISQSPPIPISHFLSHCYTS